VSNNPPRESESYAGRTIDLLNLYDAQEHERLDVDGVVKATELNYMNRTLNLQNLDIEILRP
jgi:hypothetical protein